VNSVRKLLATAENHYKLFYLNSLPDTSGLSFLVVLPYLIILSMSDSGHFVFFLIPFWYWDKMVLAY
jgi:hypothetical protein